jgi:ZIP family zinc transporter
VTIGIMLQNVPEGMIVVSPLLAAGVSRRRAFALAVMTGVIEVVGTIVGYFAVSIAAIILPFALAFAGGTMLYVVGDEMIPETHAHGFERAATYMLLVGFSLMLMMDFYL